MNDNSICSILQYNTETQWDTAYFPFSFRHSSFWSLNCRHKSSTLTEVSGKNGKKIKYSFPLTQLLKDHLHGCHINVLKQYEVLVWEYNPFAKRGEISLHVKDRDLKSIWRSSMLLVYNSWLANDRYSEAVRIGDEGFSTAPSTRHPNNEIRSC